MMRKEILFFILFVAYSNAGLIEDVARGLQGGVEGVKHHLEKNVQAVKDAIGHVIPKKRRHSEEWHRQNPHVPNPFHNHGDWRNTEGDRHWGRWGHNGNHNQQWGGQYPENQGNGWPAQGQGNWNNFEPSRGNGWNNNGQQPSQGQGNFNPSSSNPWLGTNSNPQGNNGQQQGQGNFQPSPSNPWIGVKPNRGANQNPQGSNNNGQQSQTSGQGNVNGENNGGLVNNWNPQGTNNGQQVVNPNEPSPGNRPVISTPAPTITTTEEIFSIDVRAGKPEESEPENEEGVVAIGNRFFMSVPSNCGRGAAVVGKWCRNIY